MKHTTFYICQQCGNETGKWFGRCPACGEWNTLTETIRLASKKKGAKTSVPSDARVHALSQVEHTSQNRIETGLPEFDRVMGGGIVRGSVTLLSGDPGVGKSTLLLQILSATGGLYITAEESAEQIKIRSRRLRIADRDVDILSSVELESVLPSLEAWIRNSPRAKKGIVVIDSIQTIGSSQLDGIAGTVGQVRFCGEELTKRAKTLNTPFVIIGHVTKQGTIAGPKILEHIVDTVLYLEGERFANARILRTLKNRFGAVEEVGIFEMHDDGLRQVSNPSKLFLESRITNVPGSAITVLLEGTRPIVVEIQALTVPTQLAIPRRIATGVDVNRLQLIIAILQKHLNLPLGSSDVFVNVSGGLKVEEPGADLAVALAIVSSFRNIPIDQHTVILGELGLLGEVRSVSSEMRRVKEAKRIGYGTPVTSAQASTVSEAAARVLGRQRRTREGRSPS